jgi:hypothetical protein
LPLALQPTFILPRDVHDLRDGVFKGIEIRERLGVAAQAQQHLQCLQFFPQFEQHRNFVAAGVRAHYQPQRLSGAGAQVCTQCVFLVASEVIHDLFQV